MGFVTSANATANNALASYAHKRGDIREASKQAETGLRYPSSSKLAASGMFEIWGKMIKNTSEVEQYKSTLSITTSRLDIQEQSLSSMISSMQDFRNLVIMGMNGSTELDLASHAKTALQTLQMKFNSPDINDTPAFASLQQDTPPIGSGTVTDISTQSIWDILPQGAGFPVSGSSVAGAGPTFTYNPATMLTTKYTSDAPYSSTVELSTSITVEQNTPITSDAIRNSIGALQIFAFSGFPTPKVEKAEGLKLLEQSIQELISLRQGVQTRLEQANLSVTEVENMEESIASVNEIFRWDEADATAVIPGLNRSCEEILTLLAMQSKARTLASML